jgi:hypothetical protein
VVLRDITLVTVVTEGDPLAAELFAFSDAAAGSAWWLTAANELDLGAAPRTVHRTGRRIPTDVDSAAIEQYITQTIAAQGPEPDGHTLYLVYLPPGIRHFDAAAERPNTDCVNLSGFHGVLGARGDAWAFVQRCPAPSGETELEHLTLVASAQIVDAVSNPTGRGYTLGPAPTESPWSLPVWRSYEERGHVELADLCKGARVLEGGHLYARYWSNAAAAQAGKDPCAPAVEWPYFNVGGPEDWYAVEPGKAVRIPLVGWANRERQDWVVRAAIKHATASGWGAAITSDRLRGDGGVINHGRGAQLHVSAPAGAPSGSFAVVVLQSEDITPTGAPEPGHDRFHARPVGVYVP